MHTQTAEAGETALTATIAINPADAPSVQFRIRFDGMVP